MNEPETLWILTEERPKPNVLKLIIKKFSNTSNVGLTFQDLEISPDFDDGGNFTSTYSVSGFESFQIKRIKLKIISGTGSFVDFLVYFQNTEPRPEEFPVLAIEETKTDSQEARNTAVLQRGIKFVYMLD